MPDKSLLERLDDCEKIQGDLQTELVKHSERLRELEECLRDSVILSRTLYAYLGTDRATSAPAENTRREILKLLERLHNRLTLSPP